MGRTNTRVWLTSSIPLDLTQRQVAEPLQKAVGLCETARHLTDLPHPLLKAS
jgi:hypothetical protein